MIGKIIRVIYKHMRVTYFNIRVKYENMRELFFTQKQLPNSSTNCNNSIFLKRGSYLETFLKIAFNRTNFRNILKITFVEMLTPPAACISESCIEIKLNLNFIFTLLGGASKGFKKALKAFIKLSEAPRRSVKIKIEINFDSSSRIVMGRVKRMYEGNDL